MEWIQGRIYTNSSEIELITGFLMEHEITNTQVEDEAENRRFLVENPGHWDYVDDSLMTEGHGSASIIFWVPSTPSGLLTIEILKSKLAETWLVIHSYVFDVVDDSSWLNEWKKFFKPMRIGKRVVVCPEWEHYDPQPGDLVFVINPGHVFGTGLHQTTQMCIESLEKHVTGNNHILDLGCGSGILSIISMMLGAGSAFACDLDSSAEDIANENAQLNNIPPESYHVAIGNAITDEALRNKILSQPKFDIVIANIVADAIIALTATAASCIKTGGLFISSGIIQERLVEVSTTIEANGFCILESMSKDDWHCLVARYA